jgi:hypothetical protein
LAFAFFEHLPHWHVHAQLCYRPSHFLYLAVGKVRQHPFPDARIRPARKTLVDAIPVTIRLRQKTPLGTTAIDPDGGFDKAAALSFVPNIGSMVLAQEFEMAHHNMGSGWRMGVIPRLASLLAEQAVQEA